MLEFGLQWPCCSTACIHAPLVFCASINLLLSETSYFLLLLLQFSRTKPLEWSKCNLCARTFKNILMTEQSEHISSAHFCPFVQIKTNDNNKFPRNESEESHSPLLVISDCVFEICLFIATLLQLSMFNEMVSFFVCVFFRAYFVTFTKLDSLCRRRRRRWWWRKKKRTPSNLITTYEI